MEREIFLKVLASVCRLFRNLRPIIIVILLNKFHSAYFFRLPMERYKVIEIIASK